MQPQATQETLDKPKTMAITSPEFGNGKAIPREFTCHGDDVSPTLSIGNAPRDAVALAVMVQDPEGAKGPFTHWMAWNMPADISRLEKGVNVTHLRAVEGKNDFGSVGYRGPCPASGTHTYHFRVFALNAKLDLGPDASVDQVWQKLKKHTVAWGDLTGTFTKP